MYGKLFNEYYEEKKNHLEQEQANQKLSFVGSVVHLLLVMVGTLLIPVNHFFIWAIAVLISSTLILSALGSLWWKSRRFNSFESWLAHHESQTKASKLQRRSNLK